MRLVDACAQRCRRAVPPALRGVTGVCGAAATGRFPAAIPRLRGPPAPAIAESSAAAAAVLCSRRLYAMGHGTRATLNLRDLLFSRCSPTDHGGDTTNGRAVRRGEEEQRVASHQSEGESSGSTANTECQVHAPGVCRDVSAEGKESPRLVGEPTGAPPPPRRVRHFYIPGLDETELQDEDQMYYEDDDGYFRPLHRISRGKEKKGDAGAAVARRAAAATAPAGTTKAPAKSTNDKDAAGSTAPPDPAKEQEGQVRQETTQGEQTQPGQGHAPIVAGQSVAEGKDGAATASPALPSPPLCATKARSETASSPPKAESRTTGDSGGGGVQSAAAAAPAAAGADGRDPSDPADPRVLLPNALIRGILDKNKHIKKILMAALGNEFAKAGMSSDGVRTSFSVVNYQTLKQRTGLKSIPPKLLVSCMTSPDGAIDWIDISAHPTATLTEYKEAIQDVLVNLGMHATMVNDSTEPMLLPQVTLAKECQSFLMRYAIDAQGGKRMDSFQDLTNRFTLFITDERVITVHRTQCTYVEELKTNWQSMLDNQEGRVSRYLLYYFTKETAQTFMRAISRCIVEFDRYEAGLFTATRARASLAREIYHIKRRAAVYGRTLTLTKDAYTHMSASLNVYPSNVDYQEVLHDLAHMESLAEELNANADSVLQLLFQLSSYQVNELMRVLTLFSAFFIPLSFIAAVYGMNFDNLPLIHTEHGEVYCAVLMLCVAGFIFYWFKAKHFI